MCGIVGYVGRRKEVVPVIIEGLRRLEYRGYDSAGIAVGGNGDGLQLRRAPGKLRKLEEVIRDRPIQGTYGIGHTRWATHGRPTEENAHPHRDCSGRLVVVHNGIVENYLALKQELIAQGLDDADASAITCTSTPSVDTASGLPVTTERCEGRIRLLFSPLKLPLRIDVTSSVLKEQVP